MAEIKEEMVPDEVVEAGAKAMNANRPGWPEWEEIAECWKPMERDKARAAIAAALNAWQGIQTYDIEQALILPFTEKPDDKA